MAETGEGREHEPGGGRDIEEALRLYKLSAAGDYEPAQRAANDVALNKAVWVCVPRMLVFGVAGVVIIVLIVVLALVVLIL